MPLGHTPYLNECRYLRDEVLPPLRELDDEPELRDELDDEPDERLDDDELRYELDELDERLDDELDELRYELDELDERFEELDTLDERDEDVVPPLLLDELFVTVPDERFVLVLPLPWRKLLFLLLVLTLLLLLPVELVPVLLIRVEVLELP